MKDEFRDKNIITKLPRKKMYAKLLVCNTSCGDFRDLKEDRKLTIDRVKLNSLNHRYTSLQSRVGEADEIQAVKRTSK